MGQQKQIALLVTVYLKDPSRYCTLWPFGEAEAGSVGEQPTKG